MAPMLGSGRASGRPHLHASAVQHLHCLARNADDEPDEVVNRPAGPDYAAEETIDTDFSGGLTRADTAHDFDGVEVTTDERDIDEPR
jgi:hypothetical protein